MMMNHSSADYQVHEGDIITQMIIEMIKISDMIEVVSFT